MHNALSERGVDIENVIFGGIVTFVQSSGFIKESRNHFCQVAKSEQRAEMPELVKFAWPREIYANMYADQRLKMGVVEQGEVSSKVSRVPFYFIESCSRTASGG